MASDLSSSCTEVNELFNDEKEEGEISLEDVSSSEEGQPYKYPPRAFGQCPYCLSTQHCATWCKSLTINKNNNKRDAGLQGKENRRRRRYHKDNADSCISADSSGAKSAISYSTLQEKNKDDEVIINDLVPISSDSDMELVGLGHEPKSEKRSRRSIKSSKARRRRRNKSPSVVSLSLSPSSIDLTLSVNDSIHRLEPIPLAPNKKESTHSKCHHRSSDKKKLIGTKLSLTLRRRNRTRSSTIITKRREGRQGPSLLPPPRKKTPPRQREIGMISNNIDLQQPSARGNVTKLLKKVRRLEPFSSRSREKRSSLKDKLSNIIKNKKEAITTTTVTTTSTATTSTATDTTSTTHTTSITTTNVTPTTTTTSSTEEKSKEKSPKHSAKEESIAAVKGKEVTMDHLVQISNKATSDKDDDEDLSVLRQKALETKQKKSTVANSEGVKNESAGNLQAQTLTGTNPLQKLPELCVDDVDDVDNDLELRMIALRSAVLKKHNTRMQSGLKRKKKSEASAVPRIESPFTSSFIEDFPLLAKICSPTSPLESKQDIYMELDNDIEIDESPYSPSDEVGNPLIHQAIDPLMSIPVNQEMTGSVNNYSPIVKTPCHHDQMSIDPINRNVMKFITHESRPYSPTDATIYDPDLPGACFSPIDTQPLQPPPLPPLPPIDMLCPQQPVLRGCEMSLQNAYTDPLMAIPGFSMIHQALNPLLLAPPPPPPSTSPLFICPMATITATTTATTLTPTESLASNDELPDFGQTDLDGSPLVPIEQDNESGSWLLLREPIYLSNIQKPEQSGLSKMASPVSQIESKPQIIEKADKIDELQNATTTKPIDLQSLEEKETNAQKSRKFVPKRKRKQNNASRSFKELTNIKHITPQDNCQEVIGQKIEKKGPNARDTNVEDDEDVLREILLASLAKRAKDQPMEIIPIKIDPKNAPQAKDSTSINIVTLQKPDKVLLNQLKRPASQISPNEQPIRKIIKKTNVIPASTRVVNNAKRYQNLLIQRKLNQQKITSIASLKSRFKVNNNSGTSSANKNIGSINNVKRSASPQITKSIADSQRIIINLNEDSESESETEETKVKFNHTKARPTLTIPTTDFEKSVDQFLKNVRQQQEMTNMSSTTATTNNSTTYQLKPFIQKPINLATSQTLPATKTNNLVTMKSNLVVSKDSTAIVSRIVTTPATTFSTTISTITPKNEKVVPSKSTLKISNISATPQAVKHLPASQQEEYRRLKQQIFERENLRLQNSKISTSTTSTASTLNKKTETLSRPVSSPVTVTSGTTKVISKIVSSEPSTLVSPLNKITPKTQLVATISPMSKQNHSNMSGKTFAVQTSPVISKQNVNKNNVYSKPFANSTPVSSTCRLQQVKLLDKLNNTLNSQKIRAVAHKVSSLKILTNEQLNLKSSQIQRAIAESENRLAMENLNKLNNHRSEDAKNKIKSISNLTVKSKSSPATSSDKTQSSLRDSKQKAPSIQKLPNGRKSKQSWEAFKKVVNKEVESLSNLSTKEQKKLLLNTEEELITKRHSVLDDITEMSGNLRQWEIERDLQNTLNNDINKLKEQLRIAKEKLQQQKEKLNSIQPKVSIYHEKINSGRKECFRLSKICNGLGQHIIGPNYNVPTAGAELLNNKIKEVAIHTQKLCSKKTQSKEILKSNNSTKSDKIKIKNNSKSNNHLIYKRKEILKTQQNINNSDKSETAADNATLNTIIKNTNSSNSNESVTNTNLNLNNRTENEIPSLESSVDKTSFVNIDADSLTEINLDNYILNSVNNFNIKTERSLISSNILNTVLNAENILNREINKKLPEARDLNSNVKTANTINIENEKPLLKNNLTNYTLIAENTVNIDNETSGVCNILNETVLAKTLQLETEKNLSKCNDVNSASDVNINIEAEKHFTNSNRVKNSPFIVNNISNLNNENVLIEANTENLIIKENCTSENDMKNSPNFNSLNTQNVNLNSEKLLTNFSSKNLVILETNVSNIKSEALITEIVNNSIKMEQSMENDSKNQVCEISVSKVDLIPEYNIDVEPKDIVQIDVINTMSTIASMNDVDSQECLKNGDKKIFEKDFEPIATIASLNTENIDNNYNNNNNSSSSNNNYNSNIENGILSESVEEIIVNDNTEVNISKRLEKDAVQDITSDKNPLLLGEINLLKLGNPIKDMSEKIVFESKQSIETEFTEQFSDQNESTLQGCNYNFSKKKVLQPYESVLKHLHITSNKKTDGILCPFELMGTCNDGDCQFVHQSTSHCQ